MIAGERRQVTALFADMVGYTAILEQLGEEAFPFVRVAYDTLANCVREHDGAVHAFGGDSIMAVFGISEAAEEGALQACRAAMSIQAAFARKADDIEARFHVRPQIRVGVSSGVAVIAPVDGEGAALTAIGNYRESGVPHPSPRTAWGVPDLRGDPAPCGMAGGRRVPG